MTIAWAQPAAFDIGRVISATFGAIGRNFLAFLLLSALLVGVPYAAYTWGAMQLIPSSFESNYLLKAGRLLLLMVTSSVLTATIIHATLSDLNGKRASLRDSFGVGLRFLPPLVAVGILQTMATWLGYILLVVPGVMLMVAWMVTIPVLVTERTGVFGSFSRSADLTRGFRWPIFGLLVLYLILALATSILVTGLLGFALAGLHSGAFAPAIILRGISSIITSMVAAAGQAALYFELRRVKEGVGADALASVFD